MTFTLDELAEELQVNRLAAAGLVKYLRAAKLIKFLGERPSPSGIGKGKHVYRLVDGAWQWVAKVIKELEK